MGAVGDLGLHGFLATMMKRVLTEDGVMVNKRTMQAIKSLKMRVRT